MAHLRTLFGRISPAKQKIAAASGAKFAERFLKEGTRSWALCHLWLADTAAGDRNVEGFVKLTSPH
jgi:hypothetical protein